MSLMACGDAGIGLLFAFSLSIMLLLSSVRVAPWVRSALAVACGLALSAEAVAQPVMDPVVVTATRSPVALSQQLADVTVLTREDILRSAAQDLPDLLRMQPGIEMARSGGPGGTSSVFVRGFDNRFTSVLVDGVPVAAQSGDGGAPWVNFPLDQIERIEIVRGPASSVYGTDAVAGVIQIFTRRATGGPLFELGVGAGTQGSANADGVVGGRAGEVDYLASFATARSQGTSAVVNPASSYYNPDKDGYRSSSASGRIGWQFHPSHRLDISAFQSKVDAQYDAYASTADDHAISDLHTVGAVWTAQWLPEWTSKLALSDANQQYATRPSVYDTETDTQRASWQNDFRFGRHGLHATIETSRDELNNDGLTNASVAGTASRNITGSALGYDFRSGGNAVQINVRQDNDSDFGSHRTGTVAAGVALAESLRLTGSYGTAFRAPTLYQRFSSYGFVGLKPESSRNAEGTLSFRRNDFSVSGTAYRSRISDMIDYDLGTSRYGNISAAVLKGFTVQSSWKTAMAAFSGSIDWQSPRNEENGELLPRRARRHATLQADREIFGWDAGIDLEGASGRIDLPDSTARLAGYSIVNLRAGRALTPEWRIQFKVENAFDRDYELAKDYGGTERKAWVTLRWTPKQ